jgi:glycerophosphoryl diester phosphodiesterase
VTGKLPGASVFQGAPESWRQRPSGLTVTRHLSPRCLLAILLSVVLLLIGDVLFPWPMPDATSFTLVAHGGVHQTHPGREDGVTAETCTAELIDAPRYAYIENTIPSMAAAFAAGADAVELDIHRTTDGQLIVFHDWAPDDAESALRLIGAIGWLLSTAPYLQEAQERFAAILGMPGADKHPAV